MPELDRKDAYAEAGQLLRHYLSWREKLLAGYIAVVAGLAIAFVNLPTAYRCLGSALAFLGAFLTVIFWLLDRRNTELFDACAEAGAGIETEDGVAGPFVAINEARGTTRHRNVLNVLFGAAFLVLLVAALLLARR